MQDYIVICSTVVSVSVLLNNIAYLCRRRFLAQQTAMIAAAKSTSATATTAMYTCSPTEDQDDDESSSESAKGRSLLVKVNVTSQRSPLNLSGHLHVTVINSKFGTWVGWVAQW